YLLVVRKIFLLCAAIHLLAVGYSQTVSLQWAKRVGGPTSDAGFSIAADTAGNVYTVGNFSGSVDFDPGPGVFTLNSAGSDDVFISKWDGFGNFVWAKQMGGTMAENG